MKAIAAIRCKLLNLNSFICRALLPMVEAMEKRNKRISVSLTGRAFNEIKSLAEAQHIGVSGLVRKWIMEKVERARKRKN